MVLSYSDIIDIKNILGIELEEKHFDNRIQMTIKMADSWVDEKFGKLQPPNSLKRIISTLYAAYLFRTSAFESNTESESAVAIMFRKEAENLITLYKLNNIKQFKKVAGTGVEKID